MTTQGNITETADLIAVNGRIYTVDEHCPWASALAVRDGRITFVGDDGGARALAGSATTVVDLAGRLVLPGLVESHVHVLLGAALASGFTMTMSDTVEDVQAKVSAFAAAHPERAAIFGTGYNALMFDEHGPNRALLDAVVADRPVVLMDHTLHGSWANTRALQVSGVNEATPDPTPSLYVRDEAGVPMGAMKGAGATVPIIVATGAMPVDAIRGALVQVMGAMSAHGFTAAMDCGNPIATGPALDALLDLDRSTGLPMRVSLTAMINTPQMAEIGLGLQQQYAEDYATERMWFDTVKIVGDSVIDNQTAAMLEPYVTTGERAQLYFPPEQLKDLAAGAAELGHGVIMHAIGDRAVREGLNAAQALRESGTSNTRFTLTHCEVVHPDDVPRFADLDVTVQTTSNWAVYWAGHAEHLGQERNDTRRIPLRSWWDTGATVALGADWPATPGGIDHGMSPFVNIHTAMHRRLPDELLAEWGAEPRVLEPATQVLTLPEAIAAYTINGARLMGREDAFGSITPGKSADFIVLDQDLFAIETNEIWRTQVVATVFAGAFVHGDDRLDGAHTAVTDCCASTVTTTSCPCQ